MADEKLSELILTNLNQLNTKFDDLRDKIIKVEVLIENWEKSHHSLENRVQKEIEAIESDIKEINLRLAELEAYKSQVQTKVVTSFAIFGFLFTIVWGFLSKFVFPIFF